MDDKPLAQPVTLAFAGQSHRVASVREAYVLLTTGWPEEARGDRHRDAADACLKVLDGHRSAIDAEQALRDAALEAGMAVS